MLLSFQLFASDCRHYGQSGRGHDVGEASALTTQRAVRIHAQRQWQFNLRVSAEQAPPARGPLRCGEWHEQIHQSRSEAKSRLPPVPVQSTEYTAQHACVACIWDAVQRFGEGDVRSVQRLCPSHRRPLRPLLLSRACWRRRLGGRDRSHHSDQAGISAGQHARSDLHARLLGHGLRVSALSVLCTAQLQKKFYRYTMHALFMLFLHLAARSQRWR